ncbi:similar to Saccharomyces cerevisiae YHR109W CTM1 Cytochrome c lysine methyltransferase, trimethylates residue 72 of apo- cytochrome c (Cyc1p) in the cytosol [Maudiozyma barnettii]|uniref:Similar to Saccharomyces cerevisiae YHR109W CTM1 Cytochrome c lysine methyltransferase, trimethylates residue 72 of apo- cytochrome c (Cyc1p) in the cytosol n=1 Tax=Maudiozyma barnettii TaxID=61262 RepID=A0A8H2ZE72_9SACH|nr:uncharacterized protein KABA2_01S04312 [Kazachstania barnettii]CAB4252026.1 similar to Saccharomyces cerevisiae YHR109W CTM1 Cytochrome c lysine methyltransferase, trimethylates residue 72 of apo- cytochrome c (Cyc1p) in the cytosol [Kazachstania barnettii]CAD1778469.1 similar to Saccharomyces cerevisiae YHR109W CTM1 Cytochrome c lysine methyltransferase, trimethylates residue 72 of apo- cytochrome c (Cyc1p) in the cytosol [Kazachstania barnettii]
MDKFFDWYVSTFDIEVQKGVRLAKSEISDPNSGYGLYVDQTLSKCSKEDADDSMVKSNELIRIPNKVTFNIHSILSMFNDKTNYPSIDAHLFFTEKIKNVLKSFYKCSSMSEMFSETIVITLYFITFYFLQSDYDVPEIFTRYLEDVLLSTAVNNPIMRPELYLQCYKQYPNILANEIIIDLFTKFFESELSLDSAASKDTIRQIYGAIISRVLDIPHEISEKSDDFTTRTSLVPILDFVNHSSITPCCVFDVDRTTNDITLKYPESIEDPDDQTRKELFIQYSDVIEYTSFNFAYGFIPEVNKDTPCYFNLSIERDFIPKYYRNFYKWFGINPVVQFYKDNKTMTWLINKTLKEFDELLLPFMINSCIENEEIWSYNSNAYKSFANFSSKIDTESTVVDLNNIFRNEIKGREHSKNDVIGLAQLAWTIRFQDNNGKILKRRVNKQKALNIFRNLPVNDQENTRKAFALFFQTYITYRLNKLEDSINIGSHKEHIKYNESECQSFIDLCNIEIDMLKQVTSTDLTSLLNTTLTVQQELDEALLPPLISFYKQEGDIPEDNEAEQHELINECDASSLDDYNELDYTDFVTQEQEEFGQYFT